jgi:hypothetical protein
MKHRNLVLVNGFRNSQFIFTKMGVFDGVFVDGVFIDRIL